MALSSTTAPHSAPVADRAVLMRLDPAPRTPSGWTSGYMFNQPTLERPLRDVIAASPIAEVRLGWRFESLTRDAGGVSASFMMGLVRAAT